MVGFHRGFSATHDAPLRVENGEVFIRFLLDASSIEVFAQRGETAVTELIFPAGASRRISLVPEGATPEVRAITIHELRSARQRE
jgi:sucrose-6-phosphate hydrolase SacC (GH32 family)